MTGDLLHFEHAISVRESGNYLDQCFHLESNFKNAKKTLRGWVLGIVACEISFTTKHSLL